MFTLSQSLVVWGLC
ncbi:MAG: hypothetical protein IKY71_00990 [Bacteroidaceae bacterium]|nr:hypothetical protein [Bacteroidaceae bacterium]